MYSTCMKCQSGTSQYSTKCKEDSWAEFQSAKMLRAEFWAFPQFMLPKQCLIIRVYVPGMYNTIIKITYQIIINIL